MATIVLRSREEANYTGKLFLKSVLNRVKVARSLSQKYPMYFIYHLKHKTWIYFLSHQSLRKWKSKINLQTLKNHSVYLYAKTLPQKVMKITWLDMTKKLLFWLKKRHFSLFSYPIRETTPKTKWTNRKT